MIYTNTAEPAHTVFEVLGQKKLAKILGVSRQAVAKWTKPPSSGGYGGRVPHHHRSTVLYLAAKSSHPKAALITASFLEQIGSGDTMASMQSRGVL